MTHFHLPSFLMGVGVVIILGIAGAYTFGLTPHQNPIATSPSQAPQSPSPDTSTPPSGDAPSSTNTPTNDELGLPAFAPKDPTVVRHQHYTLRYREEHEQAEWVAYRLEAAEAGGQTARANDFRPDPAVSTGSATPDDYRGSGYDRGHLAPAGDFRQSREAMSETFFMSNMSPQRRDFNGGIWRILEEQVRSWIKKYKELYIVTGPVLEPNLPKIGKQNRVSVPRRYYKIVASLRAGKEQAIAFLMNNEDSLEPLSAFVVSIDEIERITGIDFFPRLDDALENRLEASTDTKGWWFNKPRR